MAEYNLSRKIVRCPVCLSRIQVDVTDMLPSDNIDCPSCRRRFRFENALSSQLGPKVSTDLEDIPIYKEQDLSDLTIVIASLLVTAITSIAAWLSVPSVRGPAFLVAFGVFGVFICIGKYLVQKYIYEDSLLNYMALIMFEMTGFVRLYIGYQAGMRHFDILISMMVIFGIFIVFPAGASGGFFQGSSNSGGFGCSSCSSCSSCGGGGCGGGGGGCGGCGG